MRRTGCRRIDLGVHSGITGCERHLQGRLAGKAAPSRISLSIVLFIPSAVCRAFFFQMFTFLSRPFSHIISHRSLKLNLSQLYTLESRIAYAGWTEENLKDYTGPTPEIVKGIAENVRPKLDTTYTICESGTAGPTGGDTRNRTP